MVSLATAPQHDNGYEPIPTHTRKSMMREIIYHQEAINKLSYGFPPLEPGTHTGSYAEMMQDPAVAYAIGLLTDAIVAGGWQIEPASSDRGALAMAEEVRLNLRDLNVEEGLQQALDALWRGFAVHEVTWSMHRKYHRLEELAAVNSDQIAFGLDDHMRIQQVISRPFGPAAHQQTLPREKVWLHVHRGSRIKPAGESLLEPAYRAWSSKNRLLQFWGLSIQRMGMTAFKVTVPGNTNATRQAQILSQLYQGRLDGVYLVPEDVLVEAMNPTAWANLTFEKAIDYQDAEVLRAILYFSMSGGAVGSTHVTGTALTEIYRATTFRLKRLSQALARSFCTDIIQPLCTSNWGARPEQCPRLVLGNPDAANIVALGPVLAQLIAAGITDAQTAAQQLGLPEPENVQPQNQDSADAHPGSTGPASRNGAQKAP